MDFSKIDRTRSEPLYLQIRHLILRAIQEEELLPGQPLPSISEIASAAGVSPMTARQAMEALARGGWIHTVPGRGSFVCHRPHVVLDLQRVVGWADEIRMQGFEPSVMLLEAAIVPAAPEIAAALNLEPGSMLHRVVRVQYAGETPLGLDTTYLPADRFPGFSTHIYSKPASISGVLLHDYDIKLVRGTQVIAAVEADKHTAELLAIPVGSPLLLAERTAYTAEDIPMQFVRSLHRSKMVSLKVRLTNTFALSS